MLNERLFRQLERVFGDVRVCREGMPVSWSLERVDGRLRRRIDSRHGEHGGEQYRVSCPYCGDTRGRLYFGHMWGEVDPVTNERNLWLAFCQNAGCDLSTQSSDMLSRRGDAKLRLYDDVWQHMALTGESPFAGVAAAAKHKKRAVCLLSNATPPGEIVPIDKVGAHQAAAYLHRRHFDLGELAERWGVGVIRSVVDERYSSMLLNRIYVPVFYDGKLVSWQGRVPYDLAKGSREVKYFTAPGSLRSALLYGADLCPSDGFVVVFEGVTDVWRYGPGSIAVLGQPTGTQGHMIADRWSAAAVVLDNDAEAVGQRCAAVDIRDRFVTQLQRAGCSAWAVDLPPKTDPADIIERDLLRGYVKGMSEVVCG